MEGIGIELRYIDTFALSHYHQFDILSLYLSGHEKNPSRCSFSMLKKYALEQDFLICPVKYIPVIVPIVIAKVPSWVEKIFLITETVHMHQTHSFGVYTIHNDIAVQMCIGHTILFPFTGSEACIFLRMT